MYQSAPKKDADSAEFLAGLAEGLLLVQQCMNCERLVFYPRSLCPHCWGESFRLMAVEPVGTIYTHTVIYRPLNEAFESNVPYMIGLVDLSCGVRMMGALIDVAGRVPSVPSIIGQPVRISKEVKGDHGLPVFQVINSGVTTDGH